MRVLFTTSEWPTHFFPMVPLGWALQSAGHEVRVACAPSLVPVVRQSGLVPVPLLGGPDPAFKTRLARYWEFAARQRPIEPGELLHPVTAEPMDRLEEFEFAAYRAVHRDANLRSMRESCDRTAEFARAWRPDLVVTEPQNVEGVLAGRLLGVPVVCNLFGLVGTDETEPGLDIVLEDHSDSFPRYGLPPMATGLIDVVLDPCPPSAASRTLRPTLPVRYVPYNGPGGAPDWAGSRPDGGRPRVLIAWGTSVSGIYGSRAFLVPGLLRALAGLDAEVVITAADADRAGLVADHPRVRVLDRWCPLKLLLPTCDAVVHYGSGGTGMTAMTAGVPQLALPFSAEQRMNSSRLTAAGAGFQLDGFAADPAAVADRLGRLLAEPVHRERAQALREEALARPTPAELVPQLLDLGAAR
ncbi:nucleotide disphospho-sugar-binding domain-containing protein [Kitasatospora sp. NPDC058190]|uniref:nucleotide disphospho-sugar-binding domain-containing protein n=1 Tax=Kitasatospora sp. NPDC058190 TaxID=3346371 RepID=UPI0036DE701E